MLKIIVNPEISTENYVWAINEETGMYEPRLRNGSSSIPAIDLAADELLCELVAREVN